MNNSYGANIIGYPRTRSLGHLEPIDVDREALFQVALATVKALEINTSLARLDLKDAHVLRAWELGVPMIINTNANMVKSLKAVPFGVTVARRAWAEPRHVVNTLPLDDLLAFLRQ